MKSPKTENNINEFENSISNTIAALLFVAFMITTILFLIIFYQTDIQQKSLESKDIDNAISLFQSNLSEKLSIIASSNIFMDFLSSGSTTRKELEPRFLTELLPLRSSGITGYSLTNTQTKTQYQSGVQTDKWIALKLCYLTNSLDSKNGNCYGTLQLFFSSTEVVNKLAEINSAIKPCKSCSNYRIANKAYFGSFLIDKQIPFGLGITLESPHENIIYYYLMIIFILFSFALFNKIKLRNIIKQAISYPLDALIKNIKTQAPITINSQALYEICYLHQQIEADRFQISKINEYEKKAALGYLAAGVAHDIRSPIAVMEIIMSKISNNIPSSEHMLLHQAIQSVRDIANNLITRHHQQDEKIIQAKNYIKAISKVIHDDGNLPRHILLSSLIELIFSQKKLEWQENPCQLILNFDSNAKRAWIYASPNDIKRILSNLLNNSYEALLDLRQITVNLILIDSNLQLDINDTGKGISDNQIKDVLNGMSLKHSGKGLGLSSAKKYIESLGGTLQLSSTLTQGTQISLKFPLPTMPTWFPISIGFTKNNPVIILDDDICMHNLWRHRLQSLNLSTLHFVSSNGMFEWYNKNPDLRQKAIYLMDYELRNDSQNGLIILSQIEAKNRGYLITSHAEEMLVQEHCKQLGIWLIPKTLAGDITLTDKASYP